MQPHARFDLPMAYFWAFIFGPVISTFITHLLSLPAFIFDMDGVIVDSNPFHKIALKQFCRKYGHDLGEDELREKIYGRRNQDWLVNIFGPLAPEKLSAYADEKERLFRKLYENDIKRWKGCRNFY
jgi:beta-phosphoglucomutase